MSVATPTTNRLQDQHDVNVTPGAGVDEYALTYDHDTGKFVLRAPFAGILATGATVGATSQAQAFTLGVVAPFVSPAADGTTALQLRKADGTTPVVTVDTTNARVGIGTAAPATLLHAVSTTATTNALRDVLTLGTDVTGVGAGDVNLGPGILFQAESSTTAAQDQARILSYWSTATHATMASKLAFQTRTAGAALATAMTIDGAGNVGIGTSAPGAMLHTQKLVADNESSFDVYSANTGHVSIIRFRKSQQDTVGFSVSSTNSLLGALEFYGVANGDWGRAATLRVVQDGSVGTVNPPGALIFLTSDGTANQAERMRVTSTGNVGINDTAPAEALDVTGNTNVTGVYKVDDVQVLSNRVIDARCADVANSGDATTDGLIDALRDALVAHGLIAAA